MKNMYIYVISLVSLVFVTAGWTQATEIVHDSEYYILKAQNGEKWAKDDQEIDKKLSDFRSKNGGKGPNIFSILIDNNE